MLSSVDEKLQLLALDSDEFSQGLANLTKFYLDNKDSREIEEDDGYTNTRSSSILNDYLALEDNTPIINP